MEKLHHISRGTNTESLSHTHTLTHTHTLKYTSCAQAQIHTGFSICNQTQRGELSMFASTVPCIRHQSSTAAIKAKFSMTQWRLLCRKCNQPKPPQVLMNYCGLGKDNDLSVLHRLAPSRDGNTGDPTKHRILHPPRLMDQHR